MKKQTPINYIRITQTGTRGPYWSIHDLHVIGLPAGKVLSSDAMTPIADRETWKLTASHSPGSVHHAIDGNPDSRYSSNEPMKSGMWFQIELPGEVNLAGLNLNYSKSGNDYPRAYQVIISKDGENWSEAIAIGQGGRSETQITFEPKKARFIKIIQLGSAGSFWSIHDLNVLVEKAK